MSASSPLVGLSGLLAAARAIGRRAAEGWLLVLPVLLLVFIGLHVEGLGWDFHVFYDAGRAYLSGRTPYPHASLETVSRKDVYVYPAPVAALMAPLAVLPYAAAFVVWMLVSLAALFATLRLARVSDLRCYLVALVTLPVVSALRLGTLEPVLALLLCVAWRYRDRRSIAAPAVAALVVAKLFLWPLLLWLLVSRRGTTAAAAAAIGCIVTLLAWVPLGLSSLTTYPHVLDALAHYEQTFSLSPVSLVLAAGGSVGLARGIAYAAGLMCLVALYRFRRDESLGFRLAIAASFVLSPILWGHYWTLLLVPVALRAPRLSPAWVAACWLPADSLFWDRHGALWIGAALGMMMVQLGLVPIRVGALGGRGLRNAGYVAVMALAVAAIAGSAGGVRRGAVLRSADRSSFALAQLRVDPAATKICWVMWSEGLARVEAAAIHSAGDGIRLMGLSPEDGWAHGCAVYGTRASGLLSKIADRSSAQMFVWPVRRRRLSGSLTGRDSLRFTSLNAQGGDRS